MAIVKIPTIIMIAPIHATAGNAQPSIPANTPNNKKQNKGPKKEYVPLHVDVSSIGQKKFYFFLPKTI